jgi:hypothetical protein
MKRLLKETFVNYAGKSESSDFQFMISYRLTDFPADLSLLIQPLSVQPRLKN